MIDKQELTEEQLQEIQERIEHQDVLLALGAIMKTKQGFQIIKYLYKHLDVMCTPEYGMEGNILFEYLGHLRAGNSIFKLASEADPEISASILAQLEREKYEYINKQYANRSNQQ